MKSRNILISLILISLSLVTACLGNTHRSGPIDDTYHNGKNFVEADEWIYFADPANGRTLTRKKFDDSMAASLDEGPVSEISLSGDWIYFMKGDWIEGTLYRIRADGSQKQQVSPGLVSGYVLAGDQIYFINTDRGHSNEYHPNQIYQMNGDGTGLKLLYNQPSRNLSLNGDELFFVKIAYYKGYEMEDDALHKIRIDGSMDTPLPSVPIPLDCKVYGGWVYYLSTFQVSGLLSVLTDEHFKRCLYRMKSDGSDNMELIDAAIISWTVHDNTLYYTVSGKKYLYSCALDGSNVKRLADLPAPAYPGDGPQVLHIEAAGDWLYFEAKHAAEHEADYETPAVAYRVKTDGTCLEKLQPSTSSKSGATKPSHSSSSDTTPNPPGETAHSNSNHAVPITGKDDGTLPNLPWRSLSQTNR